MLPQALAVVVEQLGRERAAADPGRVGLHDADDPLDAGRPDAGAGRGAAGDRVGRGDERIGAVVDVEQRALAALEQHVLARVERLVQQQAGVGDVRAEPLGVARRTPSQTSSTSIGRRL